MTTTEQIASAEWQETVTRFHEWLHGEVLSIRWWALFALLLVVLLYTWKKADKKRLKEIALFSTIIILFVIVLDEMGDELTLWYYPVDFFPLFPPTTAVDFACLPSVYLLIYQRYQSWKSFLLAMTIMAVVFCFLLEPFFVWIGMYQKLIWKSYYGFPIYIIIGVIAKWAVQTVLSIEKKSRYQIPVK